jgi:hypothetical protein
MGAKHSPDLFHPQHEVGRAMALPLASREKKEKEARQEIIAEVLRLIEAERTYWEGPRGPGRPPNFGKRIDDAYAAEEETARQLERTQKHRRGWREAIHGIEEAYHPFNLDTACPQTAERLSKDLDTRFDEIVKICEEADLSESSKDRVRKARRVVPKMVSTMAFFHEEVRRRVEALRLPPNQEKLFLENLIPTAYFLRSASKTQNKDRKARIRKTLDELQSELLFPGSVASALTAEERSTLEAAAFDCADVFQRSSSGIEGRNGQLSLWEHAMRRLLPKKLEGLTVVHNYFIERPDGTTAAERFFGHRPRDLVQWLLEHVPMPSRSAMNRKKPVKLTLFKCA